METTGNPANGRRTQRLDARITAEEKRLFEEAANLSGRTMSAFVVSTLREAAQRVIQEHETLRLSQRDRDVLVSALLDETAEPNAALRRAVRAHDDYTGRR